MFKRTMKQERLTLKGVGLFFCPSPALAPLSVPLPSYALQEWTAGELPTLPAFDDIAGLKQLCFDAIHSDSYAIQ